MKIAIFTDTYLPDRNGISASIDHFTKLMADDGHEIMVFCPKNGRFRDKKYPGISVKRYLSITAPSYKDMKLALPFIWTAIHDLKDFSPDVVHIQTPLGIGWVGIWASKILKLKSIQTYHTYIPDFMRYVNPKTLLGLNKIAEYISGAKIKRSISKAETAKTDPSTDEEYESMLRRVLNQFVKDKDIDDKRTKKVSTKFNDRFSRDYTRMVYNRADLVLTPSRAMKNVLKQQGVKSPIDVMSNGIDFDFFKKKTSYEIKNRIVYIGRLGYEKSVDQVVRAFEHALKTNPEIILEIYGDGPAKVSLVNLSRELGIHKKIKFHGSYDINKLAKKLHEFDFLITASAIETQGIVILEAMSSGLPVLGVDKLAVPEVVHHRKNGYISEFGNYEKMGSNILKLLEDPVRLEKFGKKSLEIAQEHELSDCKKRLIKIYIKMSN